MLSCLDLKFKRNRKECSGLSIQTRGMDSSLLSIHKDCCHNKMRIIASSPETPSDGQHTLSRLQRSECDGKHFSPFVGGGHHIIPNEGWSMMSLHNCSFHLVDPLQQPPTFSLFSFLFLFFFFFFFL